MKQEHSESVFMTEVERKLRSEGYDVTQDGDFLVVSQDGRAIAGVNDIRLLNITNDNSDESYILNRLFHFYRQDPNALKSFPLPSNNRNSNSPA